MEEPDATTRRRPRRVAFAVAMIATAVVTVFGLVGAGPTGYTLVGWNNLGMHCMDADFSVFSILPPFNTIQAQLIDPNGDLVTSAAGVTVTYEAVADPTGSINTTSAGKTNFWQYVLPLFGVSLPVDWGLAGMPMPGPANTPVSMSFDPAFKWFIATGIPITPIDDATRKNPYPLMQLVARDGSGAVLATTRIVLPVSDEMDCSACHASGSGPAARPAAGWAYDPDPQRDYRLNILRYHDQEQLGTSLYTNALAFAGYNSAGLTATVTADAKPVLCAKCHASEALGTGGYPGVLPLTSTVHTLHANVVDPTNGLTLNSSTNRSACYRCHPGSVTRCLRGAMGVSVSPDGSLSIQCQDCHGSMSAVGDSTRIGWLMEPACQQCHTGTATHNNGAIRYTNAFDPGTGQPRVAVDATFATNPDTPAASYSLFRFSTGHGGLQCAACHGSTHAEAPSSHVNDNIQAVALQGHVGTLAECVTCHNSSPSTVSGGPHGLHPVGQIWVDSHEDWVESNGPAACATCHGADYSGTVLSYSFANRDITTKYGTKSLWKGFRIGCWLCHEGPTGDTASTNRAPTVVGLTASTTAGAPVAVTLLGSDQDRDPLTYRIVGQPEDGTVGLTGATATYYPPGGFGGVATFTYAAWDGYANSNLGTVTVTVGSAPCALSCGATVPGSGTAGAPVSFQGSATPSSCSGSPTYDWDFGDGLHAATASATHSYASAGTYHWVFTASIAGVTCTRSGDITIGGACTLSCSANVPGSGTAGTPIPFSGSATATGCAGSPTYAWSFGDGQTSGQQNPSHSYAVAGAYTWSLTVTAGSGSCQKSGTVVVSSANPPPLIGSVTELSKPYRIAISGDNFQPGALVYLGTSSAPWSPTTYVSSHSLVLGGSNLKNQFPRRVAVTIRVVNPDGQFATTTFTRR